MLRERSTLIAGVSGVGALLLGVGYLLGGVFGGAVAGLVVLGLAAFALGGAAVAPAAAGVIVALGLLAAADALVDRGEEVPAATERELRQLRGQASGRAAALERGAGRRRELEAEVTRLRRRSEAREREVVRLTRRARVLRRALRRERR